MSTAAYSDRVREFKRKFKIGSGHRVPARPQKTSKRSFEAGRLNRLTSDWNPGTMTADAEIQYNIRALRDRARHQEHSNEWVAKFLNALENNVLQNDTAFSLQMKAMRENGMMDAVANMKIEEAWREFSQASNFSLNGEEGFFDSMQLALRGGARDGGILFRKIIDPNVNRFGFTTQMLEVDHLDINYTTILGNGNRVIMGTEKNANMVTVAYHLLKTHPGDVLFGQSPYDRIRVPASEIIHYFVKYRVTQCMGVPWITPSQFRIHLLKQYEIAEAVAAREASEKGGFFQSEAGDTYKGDEETQTDTEGNTITTGVLDDVSPGSKDMLPAGMTFTPYDPTHPTQQYGDFVRNALLGASAGLNMSYATLTGDLRNANYSSMRAGSIEEREAYKKIQSHLIRKLVLPIFNEWLAVSLSNGAITLPMSKLAQFNKPKFSGRRWPWVDPQADITAALLEINGGLSTRTKWTEEHGEDLEDVFQTLKAEKDLAEEYDLEFANPNTGGVVKNPAAKLAPKESSDTEEERGQRPDPGNFTSKEGFMKACIAKAITEGKEQDQAVAMCGAMWKEKANPS